MVTMLPIENYISGKFVKSLEYIDNIEPATGKILNKMPNSSASEVDIAVKAAKLAFKMWSQTPVKQRAAILLKLAELLEQNLEEFAEAESRDQGKPLSLARSLDIPRAVLNLQHFATTVQCDTSMAVYNPPAEGGILNYTVHVSAGVVAIIVPWNLPLYLLTFKLAPALAYGNTVVIKPSEHTPLTAHLLCNLLDQAGMPAGVVNVVFGLGPTTGEPLVKHPDVSLISFTGSTATGKKIAQAVAADDPPKRLSLEMGGKNAAIIFEDADLESCVPTLVKSSFLNSGQICLCTSRIFVQQSIYDAFLQRFLDQTRKLVVGPPHIASTFMGPINNKPQLRKIEYALELARQEGVTVFSPELPQLPPSNTNGFFLAPQVLTNVADDSALMQEEIFGPVTCIVPFDSEESVVHRVNDVPYGLCAAIFSSSISRIHCLAPQIEVGTVWCNCWLIRNLHMPFGGHKGSGVGMEGTQDSKEFYTLKRTICLKI